MVKTILFEAVLATVATIIGIAAAITTVFTGVLVALPVYGPGGTLVSRHGRTVSGLDKCRGNFAS